MPTLHDILHKHSYDRWSFYLLCLVVVTLPFAITLNSISIILLAVVRLPLIFSYSTVKTLNNNPPLLIGFVIYIIISISLIYTSNFKEGLFELEKQLSFILLPLILSTFNVTQEHINKVVRVFVYACTIGLFICVVIAVYKNFQYTSEKGLSWTYIHPWNFTYHYLSGGIGIHAIYFSLYLSFCLFICIYDLFGSSDLNIPKKYVFVITGFIFYFLILLSARTVLLTTFLLLFFVLFKHFKKKNQLLIFIGTMLLIITVVIAIIYSNEVTRTRFLNLFELNSYNDLKLFSGGLDLRIKQWQAIYNVIIKNNLLLGVGIGDSHENYNYAYSIYNIQKAIDLNLNAHNIYFEISTTNGLIGLSFLLSYFVFSIIHYTKSKNHLHIILLILILSSGLTESLFNTQKGIVFILFFNTFFLLKTDNKK